MEQKLESTIIIDEVDDIYGLKNCKDILINYDTFIKLKDKFDFGNYNILIKNRSVYNSVEKLVDIIYRILIANNVIHTEYLYLEDSKFRNVSELYEINLENDMIIIDSDKLSCFRKEVKNIYKTLYTKYKDKVFLIIENPDCTFRDNFNIDGVDWVMEIERISKKDKIDYINKILGKQRIKLDSSSKFLECLSNEPFCTVKSELQNLIINCKANNIHKISDKVVSERFACKYFESAKELDSKKIKNGMKELDKLIGLEEVKSQIKQIVNFVKVNRKRGRMPMLHMCFLGNPGCGKTEVARIVGRIFEEENILSNNNSFVEAQRSDLIAKYVGQTAIKTKEVIDKAKGGVLFIDEAYTLGSYISDEAGRDYGAECIATLIKEMEDNRDDLCVIFAGYTKEMEHLLKTNSGFESRIQFKINFRDYTEYELYMILKKMVKEDGYKLSSNIKGEVMKFFKNEKLKENFSNGRCVRSLFEKVKFEQAERVTKFKNENLNLIKLDDVKNAVLKSKSECKPKKSIGFQKMVG